MDHSFAIDVAQLAGVPKDVIDRAKVIFDDDSLSDLRFQKVHMP